MFLRRLETSPYDEAILYFEGINGERASASYLGVPYKSAECTQFSFSTRKTCYFALSRNSFFARN